MSSKKSLLKKSLFTIFSLCFFLTGLFSSPIFQSSLDGLLSCSLKAGNLQRARTLISFGLPINQNPELLFRVAESSHIADKDEITELVEYILKKKKFSYLLSNKILIEIIRAHSVGYKYFYASIVEKMLEAGARLDIPDANGFFPIHHATIDIQNILNSNDPLDITIFYTSKDLVSILLKHGANPNQLSIKSGVTPLMLSALFGDPWTTKLLVKNGADPKIKSTTKRWTNKDSADLTLMGWNIFKFHHQHEQHQLSQFAKAKFSLFRRTMIVFEDIIDQSF